MVVPARAGHPAGALSGSLIVFRSRAAAVALVLAPLVAGGCGNDPIAPGSDTGPVTAYFDGEVFIAESATMTRLGADIRIDASAPDGRSLTLLFPDLGNHNHLIGPGNPVSARVTIGAGTWVGDNTVGSGTITVTAVFPTRIQGSFDLDLGGGPGGSSIEVSQGRFLVGR